MSRTVSYLLALGACLTVATPGCKKASGKPIKPSDGNRFGIVAATYIGGSGRGGQKLGIESIRQCQLSQKGDLLLGASAVEGAPTTAGAYQRRFKGGGRWGGDVWLGRMSLDLKNLSHATFFGGSHEEREAYNIEELPDGKVVFAGHTKSADLPTTKGSFQPRGKGDEEAFVTIMDSELSKLEASSFLSGSKVETVRGDIVLSPTGEIILLGATRSPDFPITEGSIQSAHAGGFNEAFLTAFRPDLKTIAWSTVLGGADPGPTEVAAAGVLTSTDTIVFSGSSPSPEFLKRHATGGAPPSPAKDNDLFVASFRFKPPQKFNWFLVVGQDGKAPVGFDDPKNGITVDKDGNIYFVGVTKSRIASPGAFQSAPQGGEDCVVGKVAADGSRLLWVSILGGSKDDGCLAPVIDKNGNVMVVGRTASADFPVSKDALYGRFRGEVDAFFAVLSPDGKKLVYSTFIGGSDQDFFRWVCADRAQDMLYAVGWSRSLDFPVTEGAFQTKFGGGGQDMVVVKLGPWPLH